MVDISRTSVHGGYFMVYKPTTISGGPIKGSLPQFWLVKRPLDPNRIHDPGVRRESDMLSREHESGHILDDRCR